MIRDCEYCGGYGMTEAGDCKECAGTGKDTTGPAHPSRMDREAKEEQGTPPVDLTDMLMATAKERLDENEPIMRDLSRRLKKGERISGPAERFNGEDS